MKDMLARLLALLLFLCLLSACGAVSREDTPGQDADPPGQAEAPLPPAEELPPKQPEALPEPPEQTMEERQREFLSFLAEVNAQRRAIYDDPEPPRLEEAWTPDLSGLEGMFTEEQMDALLTNPGGAESSSAITHIFADFAAEDVETAFSLLKHSYGAYDYFGGDGVFLPIKEAVLEALPREGLVSTRDLEALLAEYLAPVLVDGHFTIGSTPMRSSHIRYMYYVDDLYFDEAGGIDPALVKPTVDGEGRLRLCLAALATPEEAEALPDTLAVQGAELSLSWRQDARSVRSGSDIFTESTLPDGTPLLTSTAMYASTKAQQVQLDRLAACGAEYAGAPVLVLDVRNNGGGSDQYINSWFTGYAGQSPDRRLAYAQKRSPLNRYLYNTRWSYGLPDVTTWYRYSSPGQFVEHDGLTLVLQNKGTASSGETVVENLRTLENTIFIGSSTLGCALVPNNGCFYLPHSGLSLYFGTCLLLTDDGENRDGAGFSPDLWVPSDRAGDAAERMIEYYGLAALLSGD